MPPNICTDIHLYTINVYMCMQVNNLLNIVACISWLAKSCHGSMVANPFFVVVIISAFVVVLEFS